MKEREEKQRERERERDREDTDRCDLFLQEAPKVPKARRLGSIKNRKASANSASSVRSGVDDHKEEHKHDGEVEIDLTGLDSSNNSGGNSSAKPSKRKRAKKCVFKYRKGEVLAFHANNAANESEEAFVGLVKKLLSGDGPSYLLHYFDMVDPEDAGGCYQLVNDPDNPTKAWTEEVGEGEVLAVVAWNPSMCGGDVKCKCHMGDDQWEDIESAMNVAYDGELPES